VGFGGFEGFDVAFDGGRARAVSDALTLEDCGSRSREWGTLVQRLLRAFEQVVHASLLLVPFEVVSGPLLCFGGVVCSASTVTSDREEDPQPTQ
jgi:hypothetical protein